MIEFSSETIIALLVAATIGGLAGWGARARTIQRELERVAGEWRDRVGKVVAENSTLKTDVAKKETALKESNDTIDRHVAAAAKSRTEIESLRAKQESMRKEVFNIVSERDEFRGQVSNYQNVLNIEKLRIAEVEAEFEKNLSVYKMQLNTAAEDRKALERRIEDAKSEHQSLSNLLISAKAENESMRSLLVAAQAKVGSIDELKDKVAALEAANTKLRHEAALANRNTEALRREVADVDAMKEQNAQLVQCLKSMENRCKQYESDARRYRSQYEESEKESDTLRFRMGDIEKHFHEMQQDKKSGKKSKGAKTTISGVSPFGLKKPDGEPDDLKEIIGIGKVFERTLNDLGVYHFRQIASFGPSEIARVNAELKEHRGRIEQDDWVGQAKELQFKKFGVH